MISTNNIIAIATGAVIGSVVTWLCTKKYYKTLAKEEVEAVREIYRNMRQKEIEASEKKMAIKEETKKCADEYQRILQPYVKPEHSSVIIEEMEVRGEDNVPKVIPEDESGDILSYETLFMSYYDDDVLVFDDDADQQLDPEEYLGEQAYAILKDCEDDILYVVDDNKQVYYEITKDRIAYEFAQGL